MKSPLIAIIDDDAAIRAGLSSLLRSAGCRVRLFPTAEAFLAEEGAVRYDCIITDVQMPGISGLDLQDQLKRSLPALPVIVLTAFPTPAIRQRALAAGAASFLSKPFEARTLLQAVDAAIGDGHLA
ncbi:response regulator transcription factor [Phenylobacterium deserti]|uniref:Response regulator n=1 Tax=Phenylobacterium deserti TaxID=1914756 RepID=A0A328AD79_9CAUL|nr:response regulator [Phenylobacterium deserti]RAK52722.1 response regulator [Phenylobacterium deserti]